MPNIDYFHITFCIEFSNVICVTINFFTGKKSKQDDQSSVTARIGRGQHQIGVTDHRESYVCNESSSTAHANDGSDSESRRKSSLSLNKTSLTGLGLKSHKSKCRVSNESSSTVHTKQGSDSESYGKSSSSPHKTSLTGLGLKSHKSKCRVSNESSSTAHTKQGSDSVSCGKSSSSPHKTSLTGLGLKSHKSKCRGYSLNSASDSKTHPSSSISSSSVEEVSSFRAALKKFSKPHRLTTGFFPSFTYHDPNFRPKLGRTKSHARTTQKEQEDVKLSKQFLEELRWESSYPREYYNFNHGVLNYWYSFDTPKEIDLFQPNHKKKPFVPHPHMHTDYPKTFLDTKHKNKDCNNYMLPTYFNRKESVSFENHATICATDITQDDCEGFVGCTLGSVDNRNLKKKRIAQYIMFHAKEIGRIPYDSEIAFFLKKFLQISRTSLKNSSGEPSQDKFSTLLMRIHDCCVSLIFGIKLRRKNMPGTKKKSWKYQLKQDDMQVFDDPSLNLKEIKNYRNYDYYTRQTSSKEMNVTPIPFCQSPNDKVIAELKYPKEADLNLGKRKASSSHLSTQSTISKKQILETQCLSTQSASKKKESLTQNLPTKNKEKLSSWSSLPINNNSQSSIWSNHMKKIDRVPSTSDSASLQICNKHIATSNVAKDPPIKKRDHVPSTTVTASHSLGKIDNTKKNTLTSNVSKGPPTVTEWKKNYDLLLELCPISFGYNTLPTSWRSTQGGMHPKHKTKAKIVKEVIDECMKDLDELVGSDLQFQLRDAEAESDQDEMDAIQEEINGDAGMESKANIDLTEDELKLFLTRVFEDNVLWDIGYQMDHLKSHGNNDLYKNATLEMKCFCPCSNTFKKWREHFHIDDVVTKNRECHDCGAVEYGYFRGTGYFNRHITSRMDSCLLHRAMFKYLKKMYPEQHKYSSRSGTRIGAPLKFYRPA